MVRIPRGSIHTIKHGQTVVLRGRIAPLKSLNSLLGIAVIPQPNSNDERQCRFIPREKP
jgi:two-component system chemotaxis sensor kinase CheA